MADPGGEASTSTSLPHADQDLPPEDGRDGRHGRGGELRTTVSEAAPAALLAQVALAKPILSLSLEGNYLGDKGVACLVSALAGASAALSLTDLNLCSNNSLANSHQRTFTGAAAAVGNLLSTCTSLTRLDLSRNGIREEGACAVGRGLRNNTTLKTLKAGWNSFGGGRAIKELRNALVAAALTQLDLSYNSITAKTAHILAEALALNTSLRSLIVDGNILNRSGAMDLHDALQREDADAAVQLSMNDCGVNGKMTFEFDPSEPAGEYSLNLASDYDLKILFNLVKISMEGRGDFQKGSMRLDDRGVVFAAEALQAHFEAWVAQDETRPADKLLPEKGELKFRFLSSMRMPSEGEELPEAKMRLARAQVSKAGADFEFAASFQHLLKGNHLSVQQALELLRLIPLSESTRRALCVEACLNKLSNPQQQHLLLHDLNDAEHDLVQKRLGVRAFDYTPGSGRSRCGWTSEARARGDRQASSSRLQTHCGRCRQPDRFSPPRSQQGLGAGGSSASDQDEEQPDAGGGSRVAGEQGPRWRCPP